MYILIMLILLGIPLFVEGAERDLKINQKLPNLIVIPIEDGVDS